MAIEPSSSSITGAPLTSSIIRTSARTVGQPEVEMPNTPATPYQNRFSSTPYPNTASSSTESSMSGLLGQSASQPLLGMGANPAFFMGMFGERAPIKERAVDAEASGTIEHYATEALKPHSSRAEGREAMDNLKSAVDVLSGRGNWQEAQEARFNERIDRTINTLDQMIKSVAPSLKNE